MSIPEPSDQKKHPVSTVPPPTVASPHQIDFGNGPEQWWTPDWRDVWRYMGWRWILFLPIVALILFLAYCWMSPRRMRWVWSLWYIIGKGIFILAPLPFIAAGYAFTSAVSARKDQFCIHCGYSLDGLPDHYRCPECGLPYSWATIAEYRRDPKWFIQRWRQRHKLPSQPGGFEAGSVRSPRSRDGT